MNKNSTNIYSVPSFLKDKLVSISWTTLSHNKSSLFLSINICSVPSLQCQCLVFRYIGLHLLNNPFPQIYYLSSSQSPLYIDLEDSFKSMDLQDNFKSMALQDSFKFKFKLIGLLSKQKASIFKSFFCFSFLSLIVFYFLLILVFSLFLIAFQLVLFFFFHVFHVLLLPYYYCLLTLTYFKFWNC